MWCSRLYQELVESMNCICDVQPAQSQVHKLPNKPSILSWIGE